MTKIWLSNTPSRQNDHFKSISYSESGRSMIEMLGVLAVVGVLSVMGIMAYRMAMIKFKTTEILSEANKRAISIAAQIAGGNKGVRDDEWRTDNTLYLSEFGDEPVYGISFADKVTYENGQFSIWIDGKIPEELCQPLKDATGKGTPMLFVSSCPSDNEDDWSTFIFYDDLATHDDYCKNDRIYEDYAEDPCGHPFDGECTSNADCEKEEFCNVKYHPINASPTDSECVTLTDGGEYVLTGDLTVLVSQEGFTYEGAKNWCQAHGKSLISLSDFGCYEENSSTPRSSPGLCYGQNSQNVSEIASKFKQLVSRTYYWTKDKNLQDRNKILALATNESFVHVYGIYRSGESGLHSVPQAVCK